MLFRSFALFASISLVPSQAISQMQGDYPTAAKINSIWQQQKIGVCWEQSIHVGSVEAKWVREAVENSWQTYGNFEFVGWGQCGSIPQQGDGIRIAVADVNPHVKNLGRFLDGVPRGMVLNFTFGSFSESCRFSREECIKVVAVHEFGHALGITHEQNRSDAPGWCREESQGTTGDWHVTSYDEASVMNYCNPKWGNDGILSELDIEGIRALYPKFIPPSIDERAWYRMVTRVSDMCIHVQNANGNDRNALLQWTCQDTPEFHFQFTRDASGFFRIRTRYGKCIHVKNGPTTEWRKPLWQWSCGNGREFLFRLNQTEDGWTVIRSESGTCFHVAHGPNRNLREPLWSWSCVNQPEFYLKLERV